MKKHINPILLLLIGISLPFSVFSWGQTGHRIIGQIAENHLSKEALKKIDEVLEGESIAMASNWMDFIKSDPKYNYMKPWHYCTVPDSLTYEQAGTPDQGDVYEAINKFINEIKTGRYSVDEKYALKCLIHLVGDVHQPLHVGNGKDRGGNDIKLLFFNEPTNLHRIWDMDIIDHQQLSYTEYSNWIDTVAQDQILLWQVDPVIVWVEESKAMRYSAYEFNGKNNLTYRYIYDHIDQINLRLEQAGVRLAGILEELYG